MASLSDGDVEHLLGSVPFFQKLDRLHIARLIGNLDRVDVAADSTIINEGAEADGLNLLRTGRVKVSVQTPAGERLLSEIEAPAHFGELGLFLERRTSSVVALTDATLYKLSRARFDQLLAEQPHFGKLVASSAVEVLERSQRLLLGAPLAERATNQSHTLMPAGRSRTAAVRTASLVAMIGLPLALWLLPPPSGLSISGWHALPIVAGAALGWLLEPLPDFVVALMMASAWGISGLAPPTQILAGFSGSSWLAALGSFALAGAMTRSGLMFRIALWLLDRFPMTYVGQVVGLLAGGIAITPLVPLGVARVAAATSLADELAEDLGYAPKSRARAGLGLAAIAGYGMFSSIFLSGLVMNFFVLDLLPPADRQRFGFGTWLVAAAPAGLVMLGAAMLLLLVLLRPETTPRLTREVIQQQRKALGRLGRAEVITVAAVAVLLAGLIVQHLVQIDTAWLALLAVIVLAVGGVLDREKYRSAIDWGFLTLFGILLGSAGVLSTAGLAAWIARGLVPLASSIGSSAAVLLLLGVAVIACRLVLPWIPATLLLSATLIPAAPSIGLSPWLVGFVVLFVGNAWLLPRQCDYYRIVRDATKGQMLSQRQTALAGMIFTAGSIAGIAVSLPWWQAIGVM